jgi:circadian clock protein KaiB
MSKKISNKKPKKIKEKVDAVGAGEEKYVLRLFVAGILPNSAHAIINCKAICEKHLKGRYELEVVDIYQQPDLALEENIIAVPMLIKKFPLPEERVIGDLSDTKKVLKGLHI